MYVVDMGISGVCFTKKYVERYLRTVLTHCYPATVRGYVLYVQQTCVTLGIAKSYRLFNATYTPWGVRRSTYSFLLCAHPYVHVDSL